MTMTADSQVAIVADDDCHHHHSQSADNDSTTYQELISFLSSPRSDLRKAAVEATLASLTSPNDEDVNSAARHLTSHNAIVPLCRIASIASNTEVKSNDALAALAILCSHPLVGDQCIHDFIESDCRGIGRMLEIALSNPPPMLPPSAMLSTSISSRLALECNEWRERVNYACALLANAVRTERGAVDFVGRSFPDEAVPSSSSSSSLKNRDEEKKDGAAAAADTKPTATLLLSRFLNPAYIDTSSPGYKQAMEAWNNPKLNVSGSGGSSRRRKQQNPLLSSYDDPDLDEYDSDFDNKELLDDITVKEMPESKEAGDTEPTSSEGLVEYYDPYQHVAAVIMNITQLERGRDFLMKLSSSSENATTKSTKAVTTTSHLQSLLPQLTSPNPARRRGIAGTLKNCCFSQDSIWWLLNVVHIDKSLLMTLAGPEELTIDEKVGLDPDYWLLGPQKHREPDALVRLYVAEAILLLLSSGGRRARETLRERRTYIIIKLADMVEEDEEVSERLFECVQYLRRDEEGTEEGSSDRRAYEKYARGMVEMDGAKNRKTAGLLLPPSTTTTFDTTERDDDYDNID
ncbi:hypothetical protein ACHAWU_007099 [Discostella pseudostelligera]|uniref:Protein HGH1 homolog n=1 Tax=Discostella pseudostelligera TaxID=259834 RepID=A0ABD3N198_9STRA